MRIAAAQEALTTAETARANVAYGALPGDFTGADSGLAAAEALIRQLWERVAGD